MSTFNLNSLNDYVMSFGSMTGRVLMVPQPQSDRPEVDPRLIDEVVRLVSREFSPGLADVVDRGLRNGYSRDVSYEIDNLRATVKQYADAFQRMQRAACPYATVISVRDRRVSLAIGGKLVEAELPEKETVKAGDTVRVTGDSMQILSVVKDFDASGEVATVSRICSPTTAEIDRAGTTRAICYSGALEEGDRVVLDDGGRVAVANIGKAPVDGAICEPTGVTWDDIGGLEDAKRQLREAVESPTKHTAMLARYGKRPIRGVMLYGPPGNGKTMLGKAAATALAELHGDAAAGAFFYVKGPALLNMYVGNSEENVRKLFAQARRHKKKTGHAAIIFIDEADAILGKRGDGRGLSSTIVPAFLAEMDGLEDSGALVLLATNRPDSLDPAVVRDGRIDRRIKVARPKRDDARAIVGRLLATRPLNLDSHEAAETLLSALFDKSLRLYNVRKHSSVGEGVPMTLEHVVNGAMLAGVVDRATSLAMHREIGGGDGGVTESDLRDAVRETFAQAQDVDHTEEVLSFIEGWQHEVCGITRAHNNRELTGNFGSRGSDAIN